MKIELQPGEQEMKSGGANLQRGRETVGGKLYLTNQRLAFASHKFNAQAGPTDIALDAIAETRLVWTKFLNGRKKWQEAIESARPNAR